ncbi:MAG: UvrD-helicase domain-containing protein [Mycoplasmatales bacterium]
MALTKDQQLARDYEGSNVLVSAGAGSGKTTVLSQRVLRKLQSGVDISSMLIVTFTDKAAKEMKERIYNQIKEDKSLEQQLDKIAISHISTFDSYYMFLLKKYHYLLNIDQDLKIVDKVLITLKKEEILTQILSDSIHDKNFKEFLDLYTVNSYDKLIKSLLTLYNKYQYQTTNLELDYDYDDLYDTYKEFITTKQNILKQHLLDIRELSDSDDFYAKLLEPINSLLVDDISLLKDNLSTLKLNVRKPSKSDNSDLYDTYKIDRDNAIKELKTFVKYGSKEELIQSISTSLNDTKQITYILEKLDKRLLEYKKEYNSFEYSDITKFVISILENNEDIRQEIKFSFTEIMVDEYQDTSNIQERFLELIQNNNLYMVGDIKQSNYRFRHANPKLFLEKFNQYQKGNGGKLITLNKNFRSYSDLLQDINKTFDTLMTEELSSIDYSNNHALEYGNTNFDNPIESNKIDIALYDEKAEENEQAFRNFELDFIANDIANKIKSNYKVYDQTTNDYRACKYSDFAIITRNKKQYKLIEDILDSKGIFTKIEDNIPFMDNYEINVINNILYLLLAHQDNTYFKNNFLHALVGLLRSYLFDYNDNQIHDIILKFKTIDKKEDAFKELTILNKDIGKSFEVVTNNITNKSLVEIYNNIIQEFNIYNKIYKLDNVELREKRLIKLSSILKSLDNMYYNLEDLVSYLDSDKFDDGLDIEFDVLSDIESDSVSVLTMHKSKGLEYKIVYIPFLSTQKRNETDKYFISNNRVISKSINEYNNLENNLLFELYKLENQKEELAEDIRLLYVAFTRAKEKLIIPLRNLSKVNKNFKQFDHMLNYVLDYTDYNVYTINNFSDEQRNYYKYKAYLNKDISNDKEESNAYSYKENDIDSSLLEKT